MVEIVPQEPETITARMRRFDLRALWRLTAWGSAAALALAAVAFASQTENGSQRLAALASADLPVRPVATVKIPSQQDAEVARLQTQVRTLAADRDRLAERVAGLEHNIEDITGSIKRQAAPATPQSAAASTPPMISPPITAEAKHLETPAQQTAEAAAPAAGPPETAAEKMAEPPQEVVPLPPVRVATLPAAPTVPKPEFGVALASSSNLDVLHLQWSALKANFGPLLTDLRPIAAREQRGTVTHYRLVLGPLPNAAAAAKLCARLTAAHAPCHPGKFTGDPL